MLDIKLQESGSGDLAGHAEIPIAFLVDRFLERRSDGGPFDLVVRAHPEPWLKDDDVTEEASPTLWSERFDVSNWRIISAWRGSRRLGGVVLIADAPGVDMLEGRSDLALIWDLRVAPEARGTGIGSRLVSAAVDWAGSRACRELKVETQNVNVGAYRFYLRRGFALRSIRPEAYPGLPDEVQLLLYRSVG